MLTYVEIHDRLSKLPLNRATEKNSQKKVFQKDLKKHLTKLLIFCKIEKHVWRDIEVVITRRS